MTACDLLDSVCITDEWHALGGGPLKHGRGRAWWRDGDGLNVAVNESKNVWYDFAAGAGGGIIELVMVARGCVRAEGWEWLRSTYGLAETRREWMPAERRAYARARAAQERDLPAAGWFAVAARVVAEEALAGLGVAHQERETLTQLLRMARLVVIAHQDPKYITPTYYSSRPQNEAALLHIYRMWRGKNRKLTRALVEAGRAAEARAQRGFAAVLMEGLSSAKAA